MSCSSIGPVPWSAAVPPSATALHRHGTTAHANGTRATGLFEPNDQRRGDLGGDHEEFVEEDEAQELRSGVGIEGEEGGDAFECQLPQPCPNTLPSSHAHGRKTPALRPMRPREQSHTLRMIIAHKHGDSQASIAADVAIVLCQFSSEAFCPRLLRLSAEKDIRLTMYGR
jgi:hypothetical protein